MIKKIFYMLDAHMQEVVSKAGLAFIIKVFSSGLSFAFNIIIARILGAEGAGIFFLALAITSIGSIIGRVGLDEALLRFIAVNATKNDYETVNGVYFLAIRMTIVASSLVTIIIFISTPLVTTNIFNKPDLTEPLRWMSLSILPFSLLNLQAQSLKGLKEITSAMLIQSIIPPLMSIILLLPLIQFGKLFGITLAYTIATMITATLGHYIWKKNIKKMTNSFQEFSFKELWDSCKPLLIVSIMNRAFMSWAPLLLLGIWSTADEVGVYGVATRIVLLVSFILVAVNNVLAPKFAELYVNGEIDALGKVARRSALLTTFLVSPIFLVLFFYGEWLMLLFGAEFTSGAMILAILSFGQLINVFCGSVGYLLIMSKNEKIYRDITLFFALLQLLLIALLAPFMGGLGVAIATSVALVGMNIVAVLMVKKKLGILMFPRLNM